jgi:hypothetical protein
MIYQQALRSLVVSRFGALVHDVRELLRLPATKRQARGFH